MSETNRSYSCSLTFTSEGLNDPENDKWVCYNKDIVSTNNYNFSELSPFNSSKKLKNTVMEVSANGAHLRNKKFMDLSETRKATISLRYRIDPTYLVSAMHTRKIVPGVWWYNGEILLLDASRHIEDSFSIVVWIKNMRFEIPATYGTEDEDYTHILITLDETGLLKIYKDGSKYVNKVIQNPSYVFEDLKLGNYIRNLKQGEEQSELAEDLYGPVVKYDEFVIVNDILYEDQFTPPTHYLHDLFPEEYKGLEDNTIMKSYYKNSVRDTLNSFEITRHRLYTPHRTYLTDAIEKYDFDNDNKDSKSTYYR